MNSDEAKAYVYLGAAVVVAFVAYKAVTKASAAAGAIGAAVGNAASAVNNGVTSVVGGIGSTMGLPTPDETIDDPYVVRYIIDTEGQFEASKRGTAMAYFKALTMPAGSGHPMQSAFTKDQIQTIANGLPSVLGTSTDTTGSILSGPSFNDIKNNPWGW